MLSNNHFIPIKFALAFVLYGLVYIDTKSFTLLWESVLWLIVVVLLHKLHSCWFIQSSNTSEIEVQLVLFSGVEYNYS